MENDRKYKVNKYIKLMLLLFIVTILSACASVKEASSDVLSSTASFVDEKVGQVIDNHDYVEFPWHNFMTPEDKVMLETVEIPNYPSIDFNKHNVQQTLAEFQRMLTETEKHVNNREKYREFLDDESVLTQPLGDIYGSSDVTTVYADALNDIYSQANVIPNDLDIVKLELRLNDDNYEWLVHTEWKALEDSVNFQVYTMTLIFNEDLEYINGTTNGSYTDAVYTRPLGSDAVIDENAHQTFLEQWRKFERTFNGNQEEEVQDNTHLNNLVTDNIKLETLQSMFEASHGVLENYSFTSWEMHDKDVEALSVYTIIIPFDGDGNYKEFEITFSRPYSEIITIEEVQD